MNFVIYLMVGGLAGWLASMLMRRDASMGIVLNIVAGVVGGFLGGWALPKVGLVFGSGWLGFLITAFIGASVLLLVINLLTRGRSR